MANFKELCFSILLITLSSAIAEADIVLSVDTATNELVRIDSTSGNVSVVGSLGFIAGDIDLATLGNRLFATNSDTGVRVDLHEISPFTGASLSSVQVQGGVVVAEGLAGVGNQLKLGFSSDGSVFSDSLGNLALNGVISSASAGPFDFDGLGVDESGTLYGIDREPGVTTTIFTVTESPLSTNVIQSISPTLLVNDLLVSGNSALIIDSDSKLHSVDLATGVLTTTNLNRVGNYRGLAVAVPEPNAFLCLVIAGLGLALWRRIGSFRQRLNCPQA